MVFRWERESPNRGWLGLVNIVISHLLGLISLQIQARAAGPAQSAIPSANPPYNPSMSELLSAIASAATTSSADSLKKGPQTRREEFTGYLTGYVVIHTPSFVNLTTTVRYCQLRVPTLRMPHTNAPAAAAGAAP